VPRRNARRPRRGWRTRCETNLRALERQQQRILNHAKVIDFADGRTAERDALTLGDALAELVRDISVTAQAIGTLLQPSKPGAFHQRSEPENRADDAWDRVPAAVDLDGDALDEDSVRAASPPVWTTRCSSVGAPKTSPESHNKPETPPRFRAFATRT